MKNKRENLRRYFKDNLIKQNLILAFSGGVDSSLLLNIAAMVNNELNLENRYIYAVTFNTKLHNSVDLMDAKNQIDSIKTKYEKCNLHHIVIDVNELEFEDISNNPVNRCYLCKKNLFENIIDLGKKYNSSWFVDGTNLDDLSEHRPGLKALSELEIISPLALNEVSKREVRQIAKELNLKVYSKPSTPCMATRIPYGNDLSEELIDKIIEGEQILKKHIDGNVRLRVHNDIARIEVDNDKFLEVLGNLGNIINELKNIGFKYITLDLEGFRSGSMDE